MNNLKRVLSLGLAGAMLSGMMLVGASAADTKDFTDQSEIVNTNAVNTLVQLGVIKGKDTGAFDPEGIVTRGEMAKMICIVLNGGKDPQLGTSNGGKYTDTVGHWAASYIDYCTNIGIASGRGDGTFQPDATVTGTEAAKMLLVAIGYNAEHEQFVGLDWAINVNVKANQVDLYNKVLGMVDQGLSRDNAAQMIYNALDVDVVALNDNGSYTTKEVTSTVAEQKETGVTYTYTVGGVTYASYNDAFVANGSSASGIVQNPVKTYTWVSTSSTTTESLGRKYMGLYTYSAPMTGVGYVENKGYTMTVGGTTFTEMSENPIDFMGQKVKVLYKDTDDVYGLYTHGDTTVNVTAVVGKLDNTELNDGDNVVKFDGTEYKSDVADAANMLFISANGGALVATTLSALRASSSVAMGSKLTLIDNNGNGKIDVAVVTPVEVYKVNYVSSTEVTLVGAEATNATINSQAGAKKLEDTVVYDDMAKGDYVAFYDGTYCTANGDDVLEKLDMVSGTVSGTKGAVTDILVDGNWYGLQTAGFTPKVGSTVSYVAVGGYAYAAKTTATSVTGQYLLIKGLEASYNDVNASVLLSDGTSKVITLEKGSVNGVDFYKAYADGAKTSFEFDTDNGGSHGSGTAITPDTMWAYTVNSDNTYRLTQINATTAVEDILGIKGQGTASLNNKMFGTANIDDDAKIFVKDTDGYSVVSGKTVKSWGNTVANQSGTAPFVYTTNNGYNYVNAAFITFSAAAPSAADGSIYGYLVAAPYNAEQDNKAGKMFTIWDGEADIEVFASNGDITGSPVKGDIVKFVTLSDSKVKIQATYSINSAVAVDGYDAATGKITFKTADGVVSGDGVYEVVNDTKYLTINSEKKVGVAGAGKDSISLANKDSAGNLIGEVNALYVVSTVDSNGNSIKDLSLVVMDTANKISGLGAYKMNSATAIKGASNGLTITVTPKVSFANVTATVTYTVTVKGTAAAGDASDTIQIGNIGNLSGAANGNTTVATDTITITAAGAVDATYTATVTVSAADVTPTITYTAA